MTMKNDESFSYYVQTFLDHHICGERGLSQNTFISYEHTFSQLTEYLYSQLNNRKKKVTMADFNSENISSFLNHLEQMGMSISTRNQRLATIKSFCKYVRFKSPRYLHNIEQVLNISRKKGPTSTIQYLSREQLERLLYKPDNTNYYGFKDLLLLTVMSDTGARVSEIINIKISDLTLTQPATILVHGKGNKDRYVTISQKTCDLLNLYLDKENLRSVVCAERNLFLNRSGQPFTRAGIAYILQKYTSQLHSEDPLSFPEKLTPHCLRHTKAMLMLDAGQNLVYIRDTLGHEHIKTTEIYARINSKQKQAALDAVNSKIRVPDTSNIDYKHDPTRRAWLRDYCSEDR